MFTSPFQQDDDPFNASYGGLHAPEASMPTSSFMEGADPGASAVAKKPYQAPPMQTFYDTPTAALPSGAPQAASAPSPATQSPYAPASDTSAGSNGAEKYTSMLQQIQTAADPQQQAVLRDQLARQTYTDLKAAGHDVKWSGEQLLVDGRAYALGGSTPSAATATPAGKFGAPTDTFDPGWGGEAGGNQYGRGDPVPGHPGWTQISGTNGMIYFDPDGNMHEQLPGGDGSPSGFDPNAWGRRDRDYVNQLIDHVWRQNGAEPPPPDSPAREYWYGKLNTPDVNGRGEQLFGNTEYWQMRMGYEARGEDYGAQFQPPPQQAPSMEGQEQGAAGVQQASYVPSASSGAGLALTGPSYVPGEIDQLEGFDPLAGNSDLSDAQRQAILDLLNGNEPVDQATEAALLALLENPSSLDDRTVDMMKAASREEQAALSAQEDEALQAAGFAGGFDDSRWMASERLAGRRNRDDAIIAGNRGIDIQAAQTRMGDKRAAIELGASYASAKAGRKQAAVAANQSFLALQSDNAFKTAALQGDRMALRESVNQKAAELGLSADKLQLDYTLGLMEDATRRYGIDVGAQIDREKLKQAGREFQEELAFRYAQLAQADAQFGANLGLGWANFSAGRDDEAWDRQRDVYGF